MEMEQNEKIDFLDITIQRTGNNLSHKIYRKPTATNTIIHNMSCQPIQHKTSVNKFMINRLNTYPMNKEMWRRTQQNTYYSKPNTN
jgi:hypothetical protein